MKKIIIIVAIILFSNNLFGKDYSTNKDTIRLINKLSKEGIYKKEYLINIFRNVKYQRIALSMYVPSLKKKKKPSKPYVRPKNYKRKGTWDIYQKYFVTEKKAEDGLKYMNKHKKTLYEVYKKYKVDPEYIVAIIGVESDYGRNRGKYPVFDVLATLSFEKNRRNKFFNKELEAFLRLSKKGDFDPLKVKGSPAGAIGLGQFMPSNYIEYVIDFNNDGKKEMNNDVDAIASIGYYFKRHKWKKGMTTATRVSYTGNRFNQYKTGYKHKYNRKNLKDIYPLDKNFKYNGKIYLIKLKRGEYDELWYGTTNFYTITRYNHHSYYAMAVHQLAKKIREKYNKQFQ